MQEGLSLHSLGQYNYEVRLNGEKIGNIFKFTGTWHSSVSSGGCLDPLDAAKKLVQLKCETGVV